jgi:putative transposase
MAPVSHSTWGMRGQTPIVRYSFSRDKFSAIGAIALEYGSESVRSYFRIYSHNICSGQIIKFLDHLLFIIHGPIVLVWDNGTTHKSKIVKEFIAKHRRLFVEELPSYAPELNPVENIWSQTKYHDLGNFCPSSTDHLLEETRNTLQKIRVRPRKQKSALRSIPMPWDSDIYFLL